MNLRTFFKDNDESNTLSAISKGMQKSQFCEPMNEISHLVKLIITKQTTSNEHQPILDQLQSGGLSNKNSIEKFIQIKKQSFCTEFNQTISNVQSLFGYEFAKYLFVIYGLNHFISQLNKQINSCISYESIRNLIIKIKNILELGSSQNSISVKPNFKEELSNMHMFANENETDTNYYVIETNPSEILTFIKNVIEFINARIKTDNIIMFENDKALIYDAMIKLFDNLEFKTYNVNEINDILINLGEYSIAYEGSFIHSFHLLYLESLADIPKEVFDAFYHNFNPVKHFLENELKLEINYDRYLNNLVEYFKNIANTTYAHAKEDISSAYKSNPRMLNVVISDGFYEMLSNICLNLYVNIAKKISNNQLLFSHFGKSTRIQFIQILQAIYDCSPRLYMFNASMKAALHYVLLTEHVLTESINVYQNNNKKTKIPRKYTKRKQLLQSGSAENETNTETIDENKSSAEVKSNKMNELMMKRVNKPIKKQISDDDDSQEVKVKKPVKSNKK